ACEDVATEVTVSTRTSDFVTGGGFVVLSAGSGTYKGDPGSKNNFGFNVKWNKSLTNLQGGGFNSIVRSGNLLYQIKAPKIATLTVVPATSTKPATAGFTSGNCTLTVMNAQTNAIISTVGNLNLTVQMTDNCDPGPGVSASGDLIGITLTDSKGNLLYSNNWVSGATVQQALGGGNLQVHGDAGSPGAPACGGGKTIMAEAPVDTYIKDQGPLLTVKVYPNPSTSNFNLQMDGGSKDKLEITVTDILGHVVETRTSSSGASVTLGNNLKVGMYLVQIKQGQIFRFYRIFKQ
ncbi:MAG TPA: T9SS type A sorting domain-containing protein, partial [Mucilaginibacter sp.]|nr:T9SS type A sorting domain-containing protein [Mucilaginibacter sp.]